jgi:hypothetical protein
MEYKVETSLEDFQAWSGGKDTLETLIEKGDCEQLESIMEDMWGEKIPTETDINDFLWFERDTIAEWLGYRDWDAYEYEGWSLQDLEDAKSWWGDEAEPDAKEKLSGKMREDFEDEDDWFDAVDEWWEDLDDAKKVELYQNN